MMRGLFWLSAAALAFLLPFLSAASLDHAAESDLVTEMSRLIRESQAAWSLQSAVHKSNLREVVSALPGITLPPQFHLRTAGQVIRYMEYEKYDGSILDFLDELIPRMNLEQGQLNKMTCVNVFDLMLLAMSKLNSDESDELGLLVQSALFIDFLKQLNGEKSSIMGKSVYESALTAQGATQGASSPPSDSTALKSFATTFPDMYPAVVIAGTCFYIDPASGDLYFKQHGRTKRRLVEWGQEPMQLTLQALDQEPPTASMGPIHRLTISIGDVQIEVGQCRVQRDLVFDISLLAYLMAANNARYAADRDDNLLYPTPLDEQICENLARVRPKSLQELLMDL